MLTVSSEECLSDLKHYETDFINIERQFVNLKPHFYFLKFPVNHTLKLIKCCRFIIVSSANKYKASFEDERGKSLM